MDPVTAVALAGNILQFIQFVGSILDDARKLHASATGTSCTNDHVQDICGTLIDFNEKLQQSSVLPSDPAGKVSKHGKPLAECAAACRRECEDLLHHMSKLKAIGAKGPRYWRSIRAALAEVWKQNEIEELRSRIADRQRQMTLLLCAASTESINFLDDHIRDVGRGIWSLQTDSRLDLMMAEVKSLKDLVKDHYKKEPGTADYTSICSSFSKLSLETHVFEREAEVLATLNYKDRPARHEKIPDAHTTTFKWSLQKKKGTEPKYGKLRTWLSADDALFWVSGKPGSGKSTFMKYIADSDETKKCLRTWAGTHELLIVSHYFTIYGTPIQRSLEGLLRSLAFGILVRKPALIPKLLRDRWERSSEQPRWTQSELETLLRVFGAETDGMPSKICFFIDGLDEYEGDHIDICQTLRQLSQSSFIKVCLSSRPWNVFEDALGDEPDSKLYMHELTHDDIRNYTESRLQEHPRWNILQEEAKFVLSPSLINEVVSKSNGVFLWVTLVVRLLREGLTNDDSLSDLQRRLSSFPADLKEFFRHIIRTVDSFYNEKMAGTLSLALRAKEPLCLEIFSFHDFEYDDENYAFKESTELMPTDLAALNKLFGSVSRRINGRCKGLLERNGDRMEFLHRTVYDFLRTDEMSEFLKGQTKNSHGSTLSLLKAFFAWIKRSTFVRGALRDGDSPVFEINGFVNRLRQSLQYARLADGQGKSSAALTAALLDNMEHSITLMLSRGQIEMTDPSLARDIFRQLVLEAGVGGYVRNKLAADPEFLTSPYADRIQSPLYLILSPSCKLTAEDRLWILKKLLRSGHDPHRLSSDPRAMHKYYSPWDDIFVQSASSYDKPLTTGKQDYHWADTLLAYVDSNILLALLEHGADLPLRITIHTETGTTYDVTVWLLLLLAVSRVHLCKSPEAYEKTLAAMLSQAGSLVNATLFGKSTSEGGDEDDIALDGLNFWDLCQSSQYALPSETSLSGGDYLVRVFALVLSNIPADLESFAKAESWFSSVLSPDAASKLGNAVTSMRSGASVRPSKKRPAEDEKEVPEKRKRGSARAKRRKKKTHD